MNYIEIPSNFDWNNVPANYKNSTLEIKYVFDTNVSNINLPENITLEFNSGLFKNATINFNNTRISAAQNKVCFDTDCQFSGNLRECVSVNWFGVKTGVNKLTNVSVSGASITRNGYDFTNDIGKIIQIYKAGTTDSNNNTYSFQANITSGSIGTATLNTSVLTSQTNTIALIGEDSGNLIESILSISKQANEITFNGEYLIGKNNGNLAVNAKLSLSNHDTVYDFSGATIYGMLFVAKGAALAKINNTVVRNAEVYSLGDSINASEGNTNWNAVGLLAGDNNIFENIVIRMNGGVRALSIQSSHTNTASEITNTTVTNIKIIGEIDAHLSDGVDISTTRGEISNVNVSNVTATDVASVLIARNSDSSYRIKNINCNNIQGSNIHHRPFRYSLVEGGSINVVNVNNKNTTQSQPLFIIEDSKDLVINNISIVNYFNLVHQAVLIKNNISPISINSASVINKVSSSNAALNLDSEELNISNIYIENFYYAFYVLPPSNTIKSALIKGLIVKGVEEIFNNEVVNRNILIDNVSIMDGNNQPISGLIASALASFNGVSAAVNSNITPNLASKNIESIVKNAVGKYTITFKNKIYSYPPIISGQGRQYQGYGKVITYESYPIVATGTKEITVRCQNPNGTLGDSDLITVIVF